MGTAVGFTLSLLKRSVTKPKILTDDIFMKIDKQKHISSSCIQKLRAMDSWVRMSDFHRCFVTLKDFVR